MSFTLHSQLAADTNLVRDEEDLLLLMMNDAQYPWFIVVPKVENATEWHDLSQEMQVRLHTYCVELGKVIKTAFQCTKINTAALGNMVSQLHVHVIGRTPHDPAWPKPVWGQCPPLAMDESEATRRIQTLEQHF